MASNQKTWSGSGTFKRGKQIGGVLFRAVGGFFTDDTKLSIQLSVDSPGLIQTTDCPGNPPTHDVRNVKLISPATSPNDPDLMDLNLDISYNIFAGSTIPYSQMTNQLHEVKWSAIPPTPGSTPDPKSPR